MIDRNRSSLGGAVDAPPGPGVFSPQEAPRRGRIGARDMATASLAQGKVGLRRALLTLAIAGFALGVAVVLLLATSDHAELRGWEATVAVLIGGGFIGAGLYAWWRRPANNFGPLMTATGFLFFVSEL